MLEVGNNGILSSIIVVISYTVYSSISNSSSTVNSSNQLAQGQVGKY